MSRFRRLVVLGTLVVGLALTLAFAVGSHRAGIAYGASGYGSDTVPPRQLAVAPGSNSGGSNTGLIVGIGIGVLFFGATGGAVFWQKTHANP
jgi:hypothetical protein